jgi:hypothetical protein
MNDELKGSDDVLHLSGGAENGRLVDELGTYE